MEIAKKPLVGLALTIEDDFLRASSPLFDDGLVEVLEWTFDVGWGATPPPLWADNLIDSFSSQNCLLGHGVTYSPLSAKHTERQKQWLVCLKEECRLRSYQHVSEHFGWMAAGTFHQSAPLPLLRTRESVRIGVENLKRLAESTQVPVGLENLAFAFGLEDVHQHGLFLEELLAPVNGFLLLDLHNLYCQAHNFQISAGTLLDTYPLQRVRELHVSGGSWSESLNGFDRIRRDTHDEAIPEEVFDLLATALERCPHVETIIFEQIGTSLDNDQKINQFQNDFKRIKQIVQRHKRAN